MRSLRLSSFPNEMSWNLQEAVQDNMDISTTNIQLCPSLVTKQKQTNDTNIGMQP